MLWKIIGYFYSISQKNSTCDRNIFWGIIKWCKKNWTPSFFIYKYIKYIKSVWEQMNWEVVGSCSWRILSPRDPFLYTLKTEHQKFSDVFRRYRKGALGWNGLIYLTLSWRRPLSYRNQSTICGANQWTGFYMITVSAMEELKSLINIVLSLLLTLDIFFKHSTHSSSVVIDDFDWSCIYPSSIYLFTVNTGNTRTMCEICSKLTIKRP